MSRGVDTGVENVSSKKTSIDEAVEDLSRFDQSTKCREAIEETGNFSINPQAIEKVSRLR